MSDQPISADAIDSFKLFSAADITALAPELDINTTYPQYPTPSIRGITYNTTAGVSPAVDLYFNEVPTSASDGFSGIFDIDHFEVLRGPQGTLRGRTSPAGAILITSHKPDLTTFGGSIEQSFSDLNLINTKLMVNIPLVDGKLALRIAGLYDSDELNDVKNILTGTRSRSHTRSIRPTLEWKPNDEIDVVYVYQYRSTGLNQPDTVIGTNIFGAAGVPQVLVPTQRESVQPHNNKQTFKDTTSTLTLNWKLPGQNQLDIVGGYTQDRTYSDIERSNISDIIPNFYGRQVVDSTHASPTESLELRFSSVNHRFWDYIFGTYIEHTPFESFYLNQVANVVYFAAEGPTPRAPDATVNIENGVISSESDQRAVFTTQTFKITKDLKLEIGARVQHVKTSTSENLPLYLVIPNDPNFLHPTSAISEGAIAYPSTVDARPFTGSANLSYRVAPDINTYVNFGRSFRPGGDSYNGLGPQVANLFHYNPETSNGYELGIKTSLLKHTLQFNADVFYQKFDGYQSYNIIPFRSNLASNTVTQLNGIVYNGNAVSKGVETGLTASLPYRFVFGLDASYVEAVWADGVTVPGSTVNASGVQYFNTPGQYVSYVNVGGQPVGATPKFNMSARLEWSRPIHDYQLFARSLLRYKSSRELLTAHQNVLGGYGLTDFYVGLSNEKQRWDVTFWLKNAFNKTTVDSFLDPDQEGGYTSGFIRVVLTPPQEFGTSLSYHF